MKTCLWILLSMGWIGMAVADPEQPAPEAPKPAKDLGQVRVERAIPLEKATPPDARWTRDQHGIIGQCIQAPNVLAPLNPLAKADAGFGQANINRDTVTRRVMGLDFIKFEF